MKFIVLIYNDPKLLNALPAEEFNTTMRWCIEHADAMQEKGELLDVQMLEDAPKAKSIRVRNGRRTITDGPFAETKEVLGGFNIIEAENEEEALRMAAEWPWAETGCVEVRPVRDISTMRRRVGLS